MNCSTSGFPILYYLPEFAQIQVHWVGDAIQPSHPLSLPSLPALNLSQHHGLFQWVGCFFVSGGQRIGASVSVSVLPVNIQGGFLLELTGWISLQSKGLSSVFPSTAIQKHQFFGTQPSWWSNSHIFTWLLGKIQLWWYTALSVKWCLCFLIWYPGLSSLFFQEASVF